ncbi:polysaccharide deacetylase family protein [Microbulbifer sp. SAOS-129_SWC]|uniref:polysaccharide deacetylase family protein n=1 Tax=Microbulbifer sp. SAOS-129_SWC TaxID=3145235 RepID=UPI0032167132
MKTKRETVAVAILLSLPLLLVGIWKYARSPTHQLLGELVSRVQTDKKVVALTFDDGPSSEYTEEILKILQENNVRATFFLVGNAIQSNPAAARGIVNAGHEIGNHSFTHSRMLLKSLDFVKREVEETTDLIRRTGYSGKITFRPPYGKKLLTLPYFLSSRDITSVTWDVAPDSVLPADASPEDLARNAIANTRPGSIILMHVMFKSRRNSMAAVPQIISALKAKGYRFVTVSQLLALADRR